MTVDPHDERLKRAKARVGVLLKDKWQLGDIIGVGGMATVYAATHRNNGKRVAVKVLHPELSTLPQIRSRFLREGYASNHVEHPGTVSVLDDDVTPDGAVFLVMELLEGETLEQRRLSHGGRLDVAEVLWATDQLLDVLAAAHAKGIIHRDIKPDNLLITRGAVLKVLDFGLARVRPTTGAKGMTRTDMLMGTLDFMAPEQARGEWDTLDGRADIWSVGATMFTLLSACPVHVARGTEEQVRLATSAKPRSIAAVRPDLPEAVIALVDKALAFRREDRFESALAMQMSVREAHHDLGGLARTTEMPAARALRGPVPDSEVTRRWDGRVDAPETSPLPAAGRPPEPAPAALPAPPPLAPPPPPPSGPVVQDDAQRNSGLPGVAAAKGAAGTGTIFRDRPQLLVVLSAVVLGLLVGAAIIFFKATRAPEVAPDTASSRSSEPVASASQAPPAPTAEASAAPAASPAAAASAPPDEPKKPEKPEKPEKKGPRRVKGPVRVNR